ncbi:ATP-dependent metallopeptidase FtsH/Yme1/Tma family protein [Enterobacter hormaechei]
MSLFHSFGPSDSNSRKVDYSTFINELTNNQLREVSISGYDINVTKTDNSVHTYMPMRDDNLLTTLMNRNVKVTGEPIEGQSLLA